MSEQTIRNHFSANPLYAAADRAAAFTDGTASKLRRYSMGTAAVSGTVPSEFWGRFVRITPRGGTLTYQFSVGAAVTCTLPPAGTQNGATAAGAGEGPIADGATLEVRVPIPSAAQNSVYFNRIGGTDATNVEMVLADGTTGTTGG